MDIKRMAIKVAARLTPNRSVRHKMRRKLKEARNIEISEEHKDLLNSKENRFSRTQKFIKVADIVFDPTINIFGLVEIFGRMDYQFGGSDNKKYVFLDVGANIGDSALYAANSERIEKVYAYEPFPNAYDMARKNFALNPKLSKKIKLFEYGWSDKDEILEITETENITDSAVNTTEQFFQEKIAVNRNKNVSVKLRKSSVVLKEILKETKLPVILKMDIEGAEYKCLKELDAAKLLKKMDILFIEWHFKGYKEITDILEKNGFVWFNEKFESEVGFIRAVNRKKP